MQVSYNYAVLILLDIRLQSQPLQNHTAVGRVVATLEDMYKVCLPHDTILKAYLHFEALSDHSYKYYCVSCGYYPTTLVMDLNKKGVFRLAGTNT